MKGLRYPPQCTFTPTLSFPTASDAWPNAFSLLCPPHLQFDFVELLDGRRLLVQGVQGLEGPPAAHQQQQQPQRGLIPLATHDTGFIQYMDSGIWHLAVYNDGKETEQVSFLTIGVGECRPLALRCSVTGRNDARLGMEIIITNGK